MDQMMGKRTAQQHAMSTMCSMSRQVNQERLAGVFSSWAHSAHTLRIYCSQYIRAMLQSWSKRHGGAHQNDDSHLRAHLRARHQNQAI